MVDFKRLNSSGIIAGPSESSSKFLERLAHVQKVKSNPDLLKKELKLNCKKLPVCRFSDLDLCIDWVSSYTPWFRSLFFWEPMATMIFSNHQWLIPVLRINLKKKNWLYKESMKHESVHISRCAFEEPVFEEILAYSTSSSKLRRVLGPIFRSSFELGCFFLTTLFLFLSFYRFPLFFCGFTIWGGVVSFFCIRLFKNLRKLSKTKSKILKIFNLVKNPIAVCIRLTDHEIAFFADASLEKICEYVEKRKNEVRWKQILMSYSFNPLFSETLNKDFK